MSSATPAVGDTVLFHPAAWDQALAIDQVHEVQISSVLPDGFVNLAFTHTRLNRETMEPEEVEATRESVYLHQSGAPKPLSYWCEFPAG